MVPFLGVSSLDLGRTVTPRGLFSFQLQSDFNDLSTDMAGGTCILGVFAVSNPPILDGRRRDAAQGATNRYIAFCCGAPYLGGASGDLSWLVAHSGRFLPRLEPPYGRLSFCRARCRARASQSADAYSAAARPSAAGVNSVISRRHNAVKSSCSCPKRFVGRSVASSTYRARFSSICRACTPMFGRP